MSPHPQRPFRLFRRSFTSFLAAALCCLGAACAEKARSGEAGESGASSAAAEAPVNPAAEAERQPLTAEQVPQAMRSCFGCHASTVEEYLGHAMASAAGPMGEEPVPPGKVTNPLNGTEYSIFEDDRGRPVLEATFPDGGRRRQALVGRIGAGRFDVSWAAAEIDPVTGEPTDRLFFAPVEFVTGHGWELAPFEVAEPAAGMDFELTSDCLGCHVAQSLARLPGAQTAQAEDGSSGHFPPNHLGADAFEHLKGLRCEVCHGDARKHEEKMAGLGEAAGGEDGGTAFDGLALADLGELSAAEQTDVCARCHLQGDARITLIEGPADPSRPLAAQIPVFVPRKPTDDFRFVSQVERMVLSRCFTESPALTCTTCHDPHRGVVEQGIPSFDQACQQCHGGEGGRSEAHGGGGTDCSRPAGLAVQEVTGEPARTADGCVDCHVRRSQPFDLPHVRATDHWVRRRIPLPEDDVPHRAVADPGGEIVLFDRQRLAQELSTPAGRRWEAGVRAIALTSLGRGEEAQKHFSVFPDPGSSGAIAPSASDGLTPLENQAIFHESRALALVSQGRLAEATRAYGDALEVASLSASARLGRARLSLIQGDVNGLLIDTQEVIDAYPLAEHPWELRLGLAEKVGRVDLAHDALVEAVKARPANGVYWFKLGRLQEQRGDPAAATSLGHARRLQPSLFEQTSDR